MFKRALVSVSDKSGLVEFLKPYYQKGMQIVSTGGTAKFLEENGFIIEQVSKLTQFPEVMGGRVKTLHPNIHMALLYRGKETSDLQLLKEKNIIPFDLLVVNLYPFEKALVQNPSFPELVEQVDIGGPSLLRGAAKNYERLTVLCNPDDYSWVSQLSEVTEQDRKTLAAKVFALTASYDSLIAKSFGDQAETTLTISGRKVSDLRYGENPHQTANWFAHLGPNNGLSSAKIIQGKPLSYNNLLDLDAAAHLCSQVQGPCSVIVKHNNPCGVAVGSNLIASFKKALAADPVSAFGGIVACNETIDELTAELMIGTFFECIVAPNVTPQASKIFEKKKNLRILQWPHMTKVRSEISLRSIAGGFVCQSLDEQFLDVDSWHVFGESPSSQILSDLKFGERVCASLKSNAIAIIREGQTIGLGMGQVNRVDAVEQAIGRVKKFHQSCAGAVLVSDAFFPFPDSIEIAAAAGVKWILQPGGSVKDEAVFQRAKELELNMITTGTRHFRH